MPRYKIRDYPYAIRVATANGILCANAVSLNPTDVIGVEIYVYPMSGNGMLLFDNSNNGVTNSYFVALSATGDLLWFSTIGGVAKNILTTTPKLPMYAWSLVSAEYDGANINLIARGVVVGVLPATGAMGVNPGQLRVGQYWNSGVPSVGFLTKPRAYHRAYGLTDHNDRLYDDRDDAVMRSNIVLDMPITEGSGTAIADNSGQANNGTYALNSWTTNTPFKARSDVANRVTANRSNASGRVTIT